MNLHGWLLAKHPNHPTFTSEPPHPLASFAREDQFAAATLSPPVAAANDQPTTPQGASS